jgi:threonine/homoserine/homoserine lactone efflux protein
MDPSAALLAGLVVGLAVAMQVGAVCLLLVETAVVRGPRAGIAAGMGVATADLAYAAVAAAAGGGAGAALAKHEGQIRIAAALVLAAVAVHGLLRLLAAPELAPRIDVVRTSARGAGGHYARFLAITAANPLTIASFAAVAAALSLDDAAAAAAFAAGAGAASAAWHLALTAAASRARRRLTVRMRRGLAVAGRLAVLAIAVHLAFTGARDIPRPGVSLPVQRCLAQPPRTPVPMSSATTACGAGRTSTPMPGSG